MSVTLLEKLQLEDEKNILIQGLPSTIEKQFSKISFSKNVTQLLKTRKIDFALVFALNTNQLSNIMEDICLALHDETKLWVAFPKPSSKIASDLNRNASWDCMTEKGFKSSDEVVLDFVWSAQRFKKKTLHKAQKSSKVVNIKENEKLAKAGNF